MVHFAELTGLTRAKHSWWRGWFASTCYVGDRPTPRYSGPGSDQAVCEEVQTENRLRYLVCLTVADIAPPTKRCGIAGSKVCCANSIRHRKAATTRNAKHAGYARTVRHHQLQALALLRMDNIDEERCTKFGHAVVLTILSAIAQTTGLACAPFITA